MDNAEFDSFAHDYYAQHTKNIAVSGWKPEFFAEYKIADTAEIAALQAVAVYQILDFGSGIGNSVPWFRKYFPGAQLTCADASTRSIEVARQRFPGTESYLKISGDALPLAADRFDLIFTACVFHHIPQADHGRWLKELLRMTRPGGLLVLFEHNPWNPLTVRAVNTCPFDVNARLISSLALRSSLRAAGWRVRGVWYRIFFPHSLASLLPMERYLRSVGFGAQYCVIGRKAVA